MKKSELFDAWRRRLSVLRDELRGEQGAARAGTRVDGSHRPANRGERAAVTSQGYLAHGLAQRLAAIDAALELLERMAPTPRATVVTGAQVELEHTETGESLAVAVLPGGDGTDLGGVRVVSPEAPIARALWGRSEDDEVELRRGGASASWVIAQVS